MTQLHERSGPDTFTSVKWGVNNARAIADLEAYWAPWLQNPEPNIRAVATLFPQGQIAYSDAQGIAATMTTTRFHWDGVRSNLRTWDTIAGVKDRTPRSRDVGSKLNLDGNTLCIMSSSVRPDIRRQGVGTHLLESAIASATELGVDYVVGSFRPSGYGEYKLREMRAQRTPVSFAEYCDQTQMNETTGEIEPVDLWLRIAHKAGLRPLESPVDENAMTIEVDRETFEGYRQDYNPDKWELIDKEKGLWECGEVGTWQVSGNTATYREPNYWMGIKLPKAE